MSDLTTLLAEHHARYAHHSYHLVCACGAKWPALEEDYAAEIALHAAHVAEVIERTYAVVELPEVVRDGNDIVVPVPTDRPQDRPHLRIEPLNERGERVIHPLGVPTPVRGAVAARTLAAALLAAANAAEGKTHDHH